MVRNLVLALSLLPIIATTAWAQEPPCVFPLADQVNAHLRVRVTRSASAHDYLYSLENRHPAVQSIWTFAVQAFRSEGGSINRVSPPNWRAGGPIVETDFYTWNASDDATILPAGTSATGFGFAQADLPTIVTFLAWGDVEPPSFPRGEAPDCENTDIIQNSFKGKTVGPKPPPATFVALEFLNYLITLVHDSRQQGWITRDGAKTSLLAKLTNAKRKLEAGETKVAKNMLKAFLNEVDATSCQEFDCPGNKPLTSEAYALLFFNGQFLWERL